MHTQPGNDIVESYARYCATHGDTYKAIDILKRAVRNSTVVEDVIKFNVQIADYIQGRNENLEAYVDEINSYEPFFEQSG